jgi:hypothetical protein
MGYNYNFGKKLGRVLPSKTPCGLSPIRDPNGLFQYFPHFSQTVPDTLDPI